MKLQPEALKTFQQAKEEEAKKFHEYYIHIKKKAA